MKLLDVLAALALMTVAAGSTATAQAPGPVPAPAQPQPPPAPRQAQTSNSTPPTAATSLPGPINATSNTAAYVSAEAVGHPAVFIGSDASPYGIIGTYTNHPLGFRTNNIARMFIDTSGNVGIGTATPGYKLDVNGAINGTAVLINGVAVGAGGSQWASGASGVISYTGGNVGIGATAPPARLTVSGAGVYNAPGAPRFDLFNTTANTGYLQYVTDSGLWQLASTNGAPRMVLNPLGNVGIGTVAPGYRLHIAGDNTTGGGFALIKLENTQPSGHAYWLYSGALAIPEDFGIYDETAGSYRLYINGAAGNVGIGTVTPTRTYLINPKRGG